MIKPMCVLMLLALCGCDSKQNEQMKDLEKDIALIRATMVQSMENDLRHSKEVAALTERIENIRQMDSDHFKELVALIFTNRAECSERIFALEMEALDNRTRKKP